MDAASPLVYRLNASESVPISIQHNFCSHFGWMASNALTFWSNQSVLRFVPTGGNNRLVLFDPLKDVKNIDLKTQQQEIEDLAIFHWCRRHAHCWGGRDQRGVTHQWGMTSPRLGGWQVRWGRWHQWGGGGFLLDFWLDGAKQRSHQAWTMVCSNAASCFFSKATN